MEDNLKDEMIIMENIRLAARIILENGGETFRAEDTAERMGKAMGCERVDVFALPSGVFISFQKEGGKERTSITRIRKRSIHLGKIDLVNQVSRQLVLGQITPIQAKKELEDIHRKFDAKQVKRRPYIAALVSAAFAVLFTGNIPDLLLAAICSMLTQWMIHLFDKHQMHQIATNLLGGLICTMIPLCINYFTGIGNVDIIVASALMPLVPGLAMANAIQDTIREDLLSGVVHAVNALLIAALIAGGALVGQSLFQLITGGI
ncbi:MAG: threonine/serine exporter family protein [Clostridiales bacterium]|nr:threonine/serine exporter family protein [Clostridiales bacterium]